MQPYTLIPFSFSISDIPEYMRDLGISPLWLLAPIIPSALTIYTVFWMVYNRFFHPLAGFPGPFLASVSPLYSVAIYLTEREQEFMLDAHKKYGKVIRWRPNLLLVSDPKLLPAIYHRYADKSVFNAPINFGATNLVGMLSHKQHGIARKRIAQPYSMTSARAMEPMIDKKLIEFKETLEKRFVDTGKKLDYAAWAQWLAYDVISELGFGKAFGFMRQATDVHGLIEAFRIGLKPIGVVARLPFLMPVFMALGKFILPGVKDDKGVGRIMRERDILIERRLKEGKKADGKIDLLQRFLHCTNSDGTPMSLEDIEAELLLVMFAGSDTTSGILSKLLINIMQNPRVHKKLLAEIDAAEAAGKLSSPVVTYDEARALPYFSACVLENFRFSPSAPVLMPRFTPKGGMEIYGKHVPRGVEITACAYIAHRDKDVYGELSEQFIPERWLDENQAKEFEKYDMGFGYGPRVCLGKNIAHLEIWKTGLEVFRNYVPELLNKEKPCEESQFGLLLHRYLWVTLKRREAQTLKT